MSPLETAWMGNVVLRPKNVPHTCLETQPIIFATLWQSRGAVCQGPWLCELVWKALSGEKSCQVKCQDRNVNKQTKNLHGPSLGGSVLERNKNVPGHQTHNQGPLKCPIIIASRNTMLCWDTCWFLLVEGTDFSEGTASFTVTRYKLPWHLLLFIINQK